MTSTWKLQVNFSGHCIKLSSGCRRGTPSSNVASTRRRCRSTALRWGWHSSCPTTQHCRLSCTATGKHAGCHVQAPSPQTVYRASIGQALVGLPLRTRHTVCEGWPAHVALCIGLLASQTLLHLLDQRGLIFLRVFAWQSGGAARPGAAHGRSGGLLRGCFVGSGLPAGNPAPRGHLCRRG